MTVTPGVQAQTDHVAPQAALDQALQEHAAEAAADRESALRALSLPEVRDLAGRAGIDLRTAESAVGTLDGEDLRAIGEQARQVEQALAGGQSRVTISTTMIIIGLLALILLIVAVK
ncbi:MAG: hypothetical protein AB7G23_14660 [Vicinamibacterales bacterium]